MKRMKPQQYMLQFRFHFDTWSFAAAIIILLNCIIYFHLWDMLKYFFKYIIHAAVAELP